MKSILFVEDDPGERGVVERLYQMCAKAFHGEVKFLTASTWKEGMEIMEREKPDVLIADLTLPPDSAHDTIRHIKEIAPNCPPIIVLTGHEEKAEEYRRKCVQDAGADDFMLKRRVNRNPEELCERVYMAHLRHCHAHGHPA